MRSSFSRLAGLLAAAAAFVAGPRALAAQKALVYCPAADTRGCDAVVAALTPGFPGGVDRASDAGLGVDLRTADLFAYAAFVVPSLAENASSQPYAFLRDATVAHKLRDALMGRRVFWSGTPDQGSTNRTLKDALLANLARFAASNHAAARGPGLVVLQDLSDDAAARYGWLRGILGVNLTADAALTSYASVRGMTATATEILTSGGTLIAYANMAMQGFQLPTGAAGVTLDAVGQTGTSTGGQVVLATMAGVSATSAVVSTDRDDYAPGTTVVMTGAGFQAGESVSLVLHEDPEVHTTRSFTATANGQGGFTFTGFAPEPHDIGVRFILTATGQASGYKAQTTFTDGPGDVNVKMGTSGATFALSWQVFTNSTCTTAVSPVQSGTATVGATGGTDFSRNIAAGQFLRLQAGAASNGGTFSSWTVSSGPLAPSTTANPLCLARDNNTINIVANYSLSVTTALSVSAATGTYGGTASLSATLKSPNASGTGVAGKPIAFSLNGTSVGTATTDASGVATLASASLAGINVGSYASGVTASFTADATHQASSGSASLTVTKATATLAIDPASLSQAYNGTPRPVTVTTTPAGLTTVGITYAGSATAPTNAGSYAVVAALTNANYQATDATGTLVIAPATPVFSNVTAPAITYGAAAAVVSGKLAAGTLVPQGQSVAVVIGGVGGSLSQSAAIGADGSFTATFASPGLSANAAGYAVTLTFTAAGNFAGATATTTLVVNPQALTLSLGNLSQTYDGQPKAATVTGAPASVAMAVTYDGNATAPTNAGSYAVVATVTDPNYTGSTSGTLVVGKATATLAFDAASLTQTYTGAARVATVTTTPASLTGVAVTYDGSPTAPVDAGTYALAATLTNQNHQAASITGTLVVNKATATIALDGLTHTYDGSAKAATATTTPAGLSGVSITYAQASVPVASPTNAGSYEVTASLANANYQATNATGTLAIAKATQTISFAALAARTYGDAPFAVSATGGGSGNAVTFSATGKCTVAGSTVTLAGAGSCTITAAQPGNGNYNDAAPVPQAFSIAKANQTITWGAPAAITYGTALSATQLNATVAGVSGGSGTGALTYTPAAGVVLDAGTQTLSVTAAATDDYNQATHTVSLTVDKAGQTIAWSTPSAIVYGTPLGASQLNAVASGVAGGSAPGALTYTPTSGTILPAGTRTLMVDAAATNNYNAAHREVSLEVTRATPTIQLTWTGGTYNATPFVATAPVTGVLTPAEALGNATLTYYAGNPASGPALGAAPTNAGTYTVVADFAATANYVAASATKSITIAKAAQTITWANPADIVYGTLLSDTQLNATVAGVGGGTAPGALTYSQAVGALLGAGSQTLTVNAAATVNYEAAARSVTLVVTKANQTITWNDPAAIDYGTPLSAAQLNATVAGVAGGSATGALTYAPVSGTVLTAGTQALQVTAAATDNYHQATKSVALTVNRVALTVTPAGATRLYGAANPAFTGVVTGVVNNDPITASYSSAATATSPVGSYQITAALNDPNNRAGNYNVTLNTGTLSVTPAPLTITARPYTVTYLDPAPAFDMDYVGLVNGEQPTVLGGTLVRNFAGVPPTSYGPSSTVPSNAGTYSVRPSGLTSGNYTITFQSGTFTINKRDQTIDFAALADRTYGAADFTVAGTASSGQPLAFAVGASDRCTISGATVHLTGAGSCTVTASQAGNGNYNPAPSVPRTFAIAPKPLTGSFTAANKVYDGNTTATVTAQPLAGLVGSDAATLTTADATFDGKDVGAHTVTATLGLAGAQSGNYVLTAATGTASASITKRPITATADAKSKTYGDADPSLTYQVTAGSLVAGDAFGGALSRLAGENVGSYAIQQGTLALSANYELTYAPANLTITKRPVTVTAAAKTKIEGGVDPALSYSITNGSLAFTDAFTGALTRTPGQTAAGSPYAILQGTLALSANYLLTFVGASFAITPNAAPVLGPISIKVGTQEILGPIPKGTQVTLSGSFTDADVAESKDYAVRITWDDGSTDLLTVTSTTNSSPLSYSATHTYSSANVATVKVEVMDKINTVATGAMIGYYQNYLVIFDPQGGFVTGGGWIDSPAGACQLSATCAGAVGKANFGFVAKYQRGATTPTGNTEFQFRAGNLNFNSTTYDWLVVAGSRAQYKGSGTVNGQAGYTFLLTAIDSEINGGGNVDAFRIKIMKDGVTVYDNKMGAAEDSDAATVLGGGSIQIQSR